MSINFAHRLFADPVAASQWAPAGPGVYAVLIKDRLCHPQPFRPIYFGRIGADSNPGFIKGHRKYWEWRAIADADANLFVAAYPMPFSSETARSLAQQELADHYRLEALAA